MDGLSLNITENNLAQLRQLLPDAFTEGKVDFDRLKAALGDAGALAAPNHYELSWAGKADARREVQRQTAATLVPDRARSVDFDTTQNVFIEGENLEVLRVLQHAYHGQVKMIYIDPPYNTGNDSFVYPDDYSERKDDYLKRAGHTDDAGFLNKQDLWQKNSKESGQYHSAWLSMMWPRLYLSRNLLREDGVIFVSIDDNEVHNLRMLMNEVFGEENFIAQIAHKARASVSNDKIISSNHNHVLLYARAGSVIHEKRAAFGLAPNLEGFDKTDEKGAYKLVPVDGPGGAAKGNPYYEFLGVTGYFRFSKETMQRKYKEGRIVRQGDGLQQKYYLEEAKEGRQTDTTWWDDKMYTSTATSRLKDLMGGDYFSNPKPTGLIERMIELWAREEGDIVLDFFAGSGTTAEAVYSQNKSGGGGRRFIVVQIPEPVEENTEAYKAGYRTIADITQARIRKAGEKIRAAGAGKLALDGGADALDLGFRAYRLEYSNFKPWRAELPDTDAVLAQLELFQEPLKDYSDKASAAMLTELLLKAGQSLDTPVAVQTVDGVPVHVVGAEGKLWLALTGISDAVVAACAAARPARLVAPGRLFGAASPDETINNARLTLADAGVELQLI